jgi:hypothetical protein
MHNLSGLVPEAAIAAFPCPRCQQPLIDPDGLGWCKACGYCRSLEEGEQNTAKETAAPKPNQLTATGAALGQTPIWFWVTFVGLLLIAGAAFACSRFLTLTPFQRAFLTTGQSAVGVALLFIGQFIALLKIAPEDSTLSFKDAVFPFRLYGLILKRLPSTSFSLYLGVWGLTAIIAVNIFVGGLGHWLTYLPGNGNNAGKTKSTR